MEMWLLAKRTAVVLCTTLLFAVLVTFVYGSRRILIAFLFAIFFAYLLEPWVLRMQLWPKVSRGSRGLAILGVYAIVGIILVLLLVLVGPRIVDEVRRLGAALPGLFDKVSSGQIARQLGAKHGWSYETQVRLESLLSENRATVLAWETRFGGYIATFAQNTIWLVLIPLLAIFFLKDGRNFADELIAMVERRTPRQFLRGIIADLDQMLAHFVRAQLVLAGLSLVVYTVVLWLLRVPYGFALSSIAGIMEFIPVVGPLVAAIAILGVAFLANYPHLLAVALFLVIWRIVQDYVSSPRIMGNKLEMHPLAAIFAVLVGAEIAGVIGVYLSVPIMASVRILWRRWQRYSQMQANARSPEQQERKVG
jgi:predicted PurR-regulated permease PerM